MQEIIIVEGSQYGIRKHFEFFRIFDEATSVNGFRYFCGYEINSLVGRVVDGISRRSIYKAIIIKTEIEGELMSFDLHFLLTNHLED